MLIIFAFNFSVKKTTFSLEHHQAPTPNLDYAPIIKGNITAIGFKKL